MHARKAVVAPIVALLALMPAAARPGARLTRDRLLELLEASGWNKAEVARRVGLSRTAVWKYMKKWGVPLQKPAADP